MEGNYKIFLYLYKEKIVLHIVLVSQYKLSVCATLKEISHSLLNLVKITWQVNNRKLMSNRFVLARIFVFLLQEPLDTSECLISKPKATNHVVKLKQKNSVCEYEERRSQNIADNKAMVSNICKLVCLDRFVGALNRSKRY